MSKPDELCYKPIIPDFEKTEVICWNIQGVLKERLDSQDLSQQERVESKRLAAFEAEPVLLKACGVEDFCEVDRNEIFGSGLASKLRDSTDVNYADSFRIWYSRFQKLGLEQVFMDWLSFRWIIPTIRYYRWVNGYELKRSGKLLANSPATGFDKITTNSMTPHIDGFWGDGLSALTSVEKKSFNVLIDFGVNESTKDLINSLPTTTLQSFNETLHKTLTQELAKNPSVSFMPRYGFKVGGSIFYWSGVGRIPTAMKERMDVAEEAGSTDTPLDTELMRMWRLRSEVNTKVHTEHFVEIPVCED